MDVARRSHARAACRGEGTSTFFPAGTARRCRPPCKRALALCARSQVQVQCAEDAAAHSPPIRGRPEVWGGRVLGGPTAARASRRPYSISTAQALQG